MDHRIATLERPIADRAARAGDGGGGGDALLGVPRGATFAELPPLAPGGGRQ